ncbi:MAG: PQQ-binding-like beta-propeller repeat protein [Pirellulales bacterium]
MRDVLVCIAICLLTKAVKADDWRQWRGPHGTGAVNSATANNLPPTTWSSTQNISWKTAIPGRGHSSPVVVNDKIFLLSATNVGEPLPPHMSGRPGEHDNLPITSKIQFLVLCIARDNGKILWQKAVYEAVPVEAGHITASLASATASATDDRVYANFGSHGLYCLDHQGDLVWQKHFGQMHTKHGHGEGASPRVFEDTLIINWDHEEQSLIVAMNRHDGAVRWQLVRDEDTSWSSPIVAIVDGKPQAIVCGTKRVRGYDLNSGKVVWECGGLSSNIVASPVYDTASGILVVGSSYEIRKLMAIDLIGASGDITDSKRVLWSRSARAPYVPSPLLVADGVYFLQHYQNVLSRVSVRDGRDAPGPLRLGELGNIYASPVSDGKHVFVTDLEGVTMVITATSDPKLVSTNILSEPVSASLAIADDQIFIRGHQHLYCIRATN